MKTPGRHPSGCCTAAATDDHRGHLETLEARYALLCDASPDVVLFHDGSNILDVAGDLFGLVGWSPAEAIGHPVVGPWVHEGAKAQILERISTGYEGRYQTNAQHRSGSVIPVDLHVRQRRVEGSLERVVVIRDLRQHQAAQERLAEGDARFRTLLEATFDGMVVHRDGYVLESNEGFARMVGATLEEVIGMTPGAVVTPDSVPVIMENIRSNNTVPYEVTGQRPDGTRYPMQIQGRAVPGAGGIRVSGFRDLTRQRAEEAERLRLQQRLVQAQKLEGLGVMAGGIAHDFNNLLTIILGGTELALMCLPEAHPGTVHVKRASDAAGRAAVLTRQMLAYAGRTKTAPSRQDVSVIVNETSRLFGIAVPKGAEFVLDLTAEGLVVEADRGQLEQVVMNLITNASEALPGDGGVLTLRTRRVERLDDYRSSLVGGTELPPAPCALLEAEDTGAGIAPADLARIFDPFYTTRFEGRGLGLATVLGVVRAHGGAIAVQSRVGVGTRFSVLLPLVDGPPETEKMVRALGTAMHGCALVVDDDREVAGVAVDMLESLGCSAEVLDSGEALIERLEGPGPRPRLILLDRVMPGMGGDTARGILEQRWPELPLLVVSGRERPADLAMDRQGFAFLAKPFRHDDLVVALAELGLLGKPDTDETS